MKRTPLKRGKSLARSTPLQRGKPMKRGTKRLKARKIPKGFRHRRDYEYQNWVREQSCLLSGRRPLWSADPCYHVCVATAQVCHVKSRGAGGDDHANVYAGCAAAHEEQHRIGIPAFERRWGVNLKAEAEALYARYQQETSP